MSEALSCRRSLLKSLSKGDLVDLLEVADQASRVGTRSDLKTLVERVMQLLPIRAVDVRVADLGRENQITGTSKMLSIGFPDDWIEEYGRRSFRSVDPVAPKLFAHDGPLVWSKLRKQSRLPAQRQFYRVASEYGLENGFSCGRRFLGRKAGSFVSCISEDLAKHQRHEALLSAVAPYLHSAVSRCLVGWGKDEVALTGRELDVLRAAKGGMTNPEIANELALSPRAVKFHLENAIEKLGARNRTEAVVIALAKGIVHW